MDYKGNYIDGVWLPVDEGSAQGVLERENPSRASEIVFRAPWSTAPVDAAVEAARAALPGWDRLGFEGRLPYLERFADALAARREELALAIATEVGKPLWEARGEAGALVAKIRIMSTEGMQYTSPSSPQGVDGGTIHRPLGVLVVLGPFNFPMHLPNGHIVPGLLNGNTLVIKPSELAGGCMQLYFECAEEAGFPPGVLNLVQGPGPIGAALVSHPKVHGVLFTGSYETGLKIKQATLMQHWKLLALEMGGKNTSIVLEDANLEQTAHELVQAAFLTCGQRCTATSRVVARKEILDELIERVARGGSATVWRARHMHTNHPLAVKFLRREWRDRGDVLLAEAEALSRLDHRHIATIFDVGHLEKALEIDGEEIAAQTPYIVMEWADQGTSLANRGGWERGHLTTVLDQTLGALAHIHALGLLHLDIKPSNVLLSSHEDRTRAEVRVVDLGLWSLRGEDGQANFGTPGYMAPERRASAQADLYGVGMMALVLADHKLLHRAQCG